MSKTKPGTPELPLERALLVVKAIGEHAPVKLAALEKLVPIPKTALHRICTQLVDFGWVRKRVADRALCLTSAIKTFLEGAYFTPFEIDALLPLFQRIKQQGENYLTLTMADETGTFAELESTKPLELWDPELSFVFAPAAVVAQSVLARPEQLQVVTTLMEHANDEERARVVSGAHARALRAAEANSHVIIEHDRRSVHLGVLIPTGRAIALTLEPAARRQGTLKNMEDHALALRKAVDDCLDRAGKLLPVSGRASSGPA